MQLRYFTFISCPLLRNGHCLSYTIYSAHINASTKICTHSAVDGSFYVSGIITKIEVGLDFRRVMYTSIRILVMKWESNSKKGGFCFSGTHCNMCDIIELPDFPLYKRRPSSRQIRLPTESLSNTYHISE